jgi:hypothetical protein
LGQKARSNNLLSTRNIPYNQRYTNSKWKFGKKYSRHEKIESKQE